MEYTSEELQYLPKHIGIMGEELHKALLAYDRRMRERIKVEGLAFEEPEPEVAGYALQS